MGRTRRLIDALIASVEEGQPKSAIICASEEHASYLFYRVCSTLTEMKVNFMMAKEKPVIFIDEARIDFIDIYEIDVWRVGHPGYGEFWTEYGEWCYARYVDKTDKPCTGN